MKFDVSLGSFVLMRIVTLCLLTIMTLAGYQPSETGGHDGSAPAWSSPLDHHAVETDAGMSDRAGGAADHNDDCWMHAGCSMVSAIIADHGVSAIASHAHAPSRAVSYNSLAYPPIAPPPRSERRPTA